MKIVILADSISTQSSGIHYYGVQFVERLLREFPDNEYHLIASKQLSQFDISQTIVALKSFPLHLRWRQVFTIPSIIKKLNPDHVIELAHFGPFRISKNIKRTTIIHDLTPIYFPQFHGKLSHWMHKLLLPGLIRKADSLIVNSSLTEQDVHKFESASKGKTKIIFPSLDIPSNEKEAAHAHGKYILTVGTIEPRKNYDLLLNAFELIAKSDDQVKLIIVGKMGWKMNHFEKLLHNHPYKNRIVITGYVSREELWDYYAKASLFVYTTNYEGFGIPVLEASYHGLPLLLSNVPTSKEIAGNAAVYFEKEDKETLCKKAIEILKSEELRNELKDSSKARYPEIEEKGKEQLSAWYQAIS